MAQTRHPKRHDRSHRLLFSHRRMMEDLLRGFIDQPWIAELDFSTLHRLPSDYVTGELGDLDERIGDVVWQVRRLHTEGEVWSFVFLVLEFQSTCVEEMALRILVYVGLFYQRWLKERPGHGLRRGEKLPPVLPIVIYNGEATYTAPLDMAELVADGPEELQAYRPSLRYLLIDERRLSVESLAGLKNVAAMLFRLDLCDRPEDLVPILEELRFLEDRELKRDLALWLRKVLLPERLPGESVPEAEDLDTFKTVLEERMETWTERWKREGFEAGLNEGRRKGLQEGRQEGELVVLERLLEKKFGALQEGSRSRLRSADPERLLLWAERVLTASRLDDVFAS